MKKIVLGIIIINLIIFVGCSNKIKNIKPNPTSSPTNNFKTYEDENKKKIQYGKLTINFDDYHVVSSSISDNREKFECKLDKGKAYPVKHMNITIGETKIQNFIDTKSVVSYLNEKYPDYKNLKIYNNVSDDSGIINLYTVTEGELTNYFVSYEDDYYLIESDQHFLEIFLFDDNIIADYAEDKFDIECADSFITNVEKTIYYNNNIFEKAMYYIIQGKDGTRYSADLSYDNEEYINNFTLKNEEGENLLTLSAHASRYIKDSAIEFLDVNMDGYVDIRFLEGEGTMNNSYELYVWDDSTTNFLKVKCEEMISHFEVHDGYLMNWQKGSAYSYGIQKLVWEGKNTLIKESEETYYAEYEIYNTPYIFTTSTYSKDNIKIKYPQIEGMADNAKVKSINDLIKNDVLKSQVEEPINFYQGTTDILTLDLNYEVTMNNHELISVMYSGYANIEGSAFPTKSLHAITINRDYAITLPLSDFIKVDDKLAERIKQSKEVTNDAVKKGMDKNELITAIQNINNQDLIQGLNEQWAYYTFCVKPNSLVISVGVPHALGDYALIEIPYQKPDDIYKWYHPTKSVFEEYGYKMNEIDLFEKDFYAVFYLDQVEHYHKISNYRLLSEIAEKIAYRDYKLILDDEELEVYCDNTKMRVVKVKSEKEVIEYYNYDLETAQQLAMDLVIKEFDLTYNEETDEYSKEGIAFTYILKPIGFDEKGRYEVRISQSYYSLSVLHYCYVDLKNMKVYIEPEN